MELSSWYAPKGDPGYEAKYGRWRATIDGPWYNDSNPEGRGFTKEEAEGYARKELVRIYHEIGNFLYHVTSSPTPTGGPAGDTAVGGKVAGPAGTAGPTGAEVSPPEVAGDRAGGVTGLDYHARVSVLLEAKDSHTIRQVLDGLKTLEDVLGYRVSYVWPTPQAFLKSQVTN